jgi:heptosyltransferase III
MVCKPESIGTMSRYTEDVLIIRPGALGDTLMLMPLLRALEGVARVTAAVRRPGLEVIRPYVTLCMDVEAGGWHALFEEEPDTITGLLERPPDKVLAFLSDPGGQVARNLGRLFPDARVRLFPGRPLDGDARHAALYLARCAARSGLPVDPEACLARAGREPLLKSGRPCRRRGVVFHPGSGGRLKNLSSAFWRDLIDRVLDGGGPFRVNEVTVLLGPAEQGLTREFEVRGLCGRIQTVHSPDMESLVCLLDRAELYAGHDSGVTHLAAMLGTPAVALFKGTDPRVWRPLGPSVEVMEAGNEDGPDLVEKVWVKMVSRGGINGRLS